MGGSRRRPALVAHAAGRARLLPRGLRRGRHARRGRRAAGRARAPGGARPGRPRDVADALHLRHDGAAEGRAPLAPRRSRRWVHAGAAARLPAARPHARGHAALPHDGHPLARRDAPRRRLLRAPGALERRRGARPRRRAADHIALPRADALLRPARAAADTSGRPELGARGRLRRSRDDLEPRRAVLRDARSRGLREPLRVDRDLHLHHRERPARASQAARAARP